MWIPTAELDAVIEANLSTGHFAGVADLSSTDPATVFARGIARLKLGRANEARNDFLFAANNETIKNAAQLELGFLDLSTTGKCSALSIDAANAILKTQEQTRPTLRARALQLLGLNAFKLMNFGDALDHLTKAAAIYSDCASNPGESQ